MIEFRDVRPADVDAMVEVQNAIHRAGCGPRRSTPRS